MKIKQLRTKLGLSQSELAEILGLGSFVRISEYENEKQRPSVSIKILLLLLESKIVSTRTLKKLAKKAKNN